MFFRCLLVLCLVTFFVGEIYAKQELEDRSAKGKAIAKLLGKAAAGIAAGCLAEAGSKCWKLIKKPKQAVNCAKDFFKQNKGKCAVGK